MPSSGPKKVGIMMSVKLLKDPMPVRTARMSGVTTAIVLVITLEIAGSSVGETVVIAKEVVETVVEKAVDVYTVGPDPSRLLETAVATEMIVDLAHPPIVDVMIVDADHLQDAVTTAPRIVL